MREVRSLCGHVHRQAGDDAVTPTYRIAEDGKSITCRICGLTSHNENDVRERYCGNCCRFHEDPLTPDDGHEDAA